MKARLCLLASILTGCESPPPAVVETSEAIELATLAVETAEAEVAAAKTPGDKAAAEIDLARTREELRAVEREEVAGD